MTRNVYGFTKNGVNVLLTILGTRKSKCLWRFMIITIYYYYYYHYYYLLLFLLNFRP